MKKKPTPLMSADIHIVNDPPKVTPPVRGPQVGEGSMSDAAYVQAFATPEECERWRAEINKRRWRDASAWIFQRCDNPKCALVMRARAGTTDGGICPRCNWQKRANLGHMYTMDGEEVAEHLWHEAVRRDEEEEQLRRAAFNTRNFERAKSGLAPLSFEAFMKLQQAEFQEMKAHSRALGKIAGLYRRQP